MNNNLQNWLLDRAYSILSDAQPVPFDCGRLCGAKCCAGGDGDGMLLFPGEETRFENQEGFLVKDTEHGKVLVCEGQCDRSQRPLACRIFPCFPYVTENSGQYRISVLDDMRALGYCPLCGNDILPDFKRKVRMAARCLMRDDACLSFLLQLSADLTDTGGL